MKTSQTSLVIPENTPETFQGSIHYLSIASFLLRASSKFKASSDPEQLIPHIKVYAPAIKPKNRKTPECSCPDLALGVLSVQCGLSPLPWLLCGSEDWKPHFQCEQADRDLVLLHEVCFVFSLHVNLLPLSFFWVLDLYRALCTFILGRHSAVYIRSLLPQFSCCFLPSPTYPDILDML